MAIEYVVFTLGCAGAKMIEKITETITLLLKGHLPEKINPDICKNEQEYNLVCAVNTLIEFIKEIWNFILPLSRGELYEIKVQPKNFLASPFKELHSRLLHLTWQAEQVAKGDYSQSVDFMGDFSKAFNAMVRALAEKEKALKMKIKELEAALAHINHLEGILPICSNCKKIRLKGADPENPESWVPIEAYISKKINAKFSHSLCPECMEKLYPEFNKNKK